MSFNYVVFILLCFFSGCLQDSYTAIANYLIKKFGYSSDILNFDKDFLYVLLVSIVNSSV